MVQFRRGLYQPQNPQKYVGRKQAMYRSSFEFKFMRFLDISPSILEWSSESISIIYLNPVTGRPTRYYPDFLIKVKDKNGNEAIEIIEIKPFKQTRPPVASKGKKKTTLLMESKTWAINTAKWLAAQEFCKNHGFTFRILTEKDLFN
jgi:hypothetical protein